MNRKLKLVGGLAVFVLAMTVAMGVSYAQYPSPAGGVSAESETGAVALPGETTTLTCTHFDADGEGIANAACTFSIVSEPGGPGGDAAVGSKVTTKLTNSQGIATTDLFVGTSEGTLVVEVEAGGFTSTILHTVDDGIAASPPQSPIDNGGGIVPPSTGSGGLKN